MWRNVLKAYNLIRFSHIFSKKTIDYVVKLKGEAFHFLLIAEKQVDRQRFRTQDQGNKSQWSTHPGSDISWFVAMTKGGKWWGSTGHGSFLHRKCLKNNNYYSGISKKSVTTKLLLAVAHGFLFHYSFSHPPFCFVAELWWWRRRLETNGGNNRNNKICSTSRTPYTDPYTGIILSIVGKKRNNRVLYRNNSDKNWLTAGALCKSVVSQFTQHLTTGFVSFVCSTLFRCISERVYYSVGFWRVIDLQKSRCTFVSHERSERANLRAVNSNTEKQGHFFKSFIWSGSRLFGGSPAVSSV